jgi:fluoride ion exporter CrcB/FEX
VIWVAIGVGGALGAMARHALNHLLQGRYGAFPAGIFLVNALGCLAIGLLAGLLASARIQVGGPAAPSSSSARSAGSRRFSRTASTP